MIQTAKNTTAAVCGVKAGVVGSRGVRKYVVANTARAEIQSVGDAWTDPTAVSSRARNKRGAAKPLLIFDIPKTRIRS
jgi:hypothetical protein